MTKWDTSWRKVYCDGSFDSRDLSKLQHQTNRFGVQGWQPVFGFQAKPGEIVVLFKRKRDE